jgi:hypothetical protein
MTRRCIESPAVATNQHLSRSSRVISPSETRYITWHTPCKDSPVRRTLFILLFALALVSAAIAATTEIPFEYREGLLWVKARADRSREPVNLLLDSGAGVSVLNLTAAERLGFKTGRRIQVCGVGTTLSGYSIKPVALTAEGVQLPGPTLAVDLEKLSSSCAKPVDGLLGADFFRGRIVQMDFDAGRLRILSSTLAARDADSVPLQLRPCGIRVPVTINGLKSQWVRLDTGCATALQWVTSSVRFEDCNRKPAIGLADISIPQAETTVQVGSHQFSGVPTGLHEKPMFQGEAGLLGNGLLARFSKITIDAQSRLLILESRPAEK